MMKDIMIGGRIAGKAGLSVGGKLGV